MISIKPFITSWNIKKHILFSIIASLVVGKIGNLIKSTTEASSIGIIGGVDGPTAVYITSGVGKVFLANALYVGIFIILMVLYKPIKSIISR